MEILELPNSVLSPTEIERLFRGFPVIGIDEKAFKKLRQIQRARDDSISELWLGHDRVTSAKEQIDKILVKFFEWPNTFFHPQDRTNALFFYPYNDMGDAVGIAKILAHYEKFDDIHNLDGMTYLELLEGLIIK